MICTKIICRVEEGDVNEIKKEKLNQFGDGWDDEDEDFPAEETVVEDEET